MNTAFKKKKKKKLKWDKHALSITMSLDRKMITRRQKRHQFEKTKKTRDKKINETEEQPETEMKFCF